MSATITASALQKLIGGWIESGKQVAAPVSVGGKLLYQRLSRADQCVLASGARPANSIKEFIFPRHQELFRYRLAGPDVELADPPAEDCEQILIGARPCDARALPILDHVFRWDSKDELYERARQRTTIVAAACMAHDDACFCTSVGSGPADEAGSDAMLLDLGDGVFEVRTLTDKGRALFAEHVETSERSASVPPAPGQRFDPDRIAAFLAGGFESPFWKDQTLTCLGCGACAYVCPACHCFDIVDEGNAVGGARVRNWDSCQFPLFTLHASGHNPRPNQPSRQRQRIYHKFSTYPAKFGAVLCTGCGNCTRNCPVGMGVLRVLEAIDVQA